MSRCPSSMKQQREADLSVSSEERKFNPEDPNCPTTSSYHRSQEMRVMHEFKESTCEVLSGGWDDA